ncbi:MAG: precorrin-3B C(17)-methyltransferase, partial [Methylococcales bacterium]|nr:precorrin-3B C(17)-methyltransferase [Methylococcales bacterium]
RQAIQLVRLDEMSDCDIGMLTTVLIGNSTTYIEQGLMITPRGYANKYDNLTGEAKEGEQAGRSLSMGLEGWKNCLKLYLTEHKDLGWEKLADYFNVSLGDVLSAVAQTCNQSTDSHQAIKIADDQLQQAVESTKNWGRLRGVIRTDSGAVVELFLKGEDFKQKADWLSIENEAFHLHINWSKVHSAYFANRGNKSYGVHFVDQHGKLIFRLLLTKQQGDLNPEHLKAYQQSWQALGIKGSQKP